MCGPVQGAILGAILYEQWADTLEQAEALIQQGEISFEPCHHYNAVGPMAGIISRSMPLWVIENTEKSQRVFCNFNEGLGKVLRFGANGDTVIERLQWMGTELAGAMKAMLAEPGPIELKPIMAQALRVGDEVHNRNIAATGLSLKQLLPALLLTHGNGPQVGFILRRSELAAHEVAPPNWVGTLWKIPGEARSLSEQGQIGEGSMKPKVDALLTFCRAIPRAGG